MARDGPALGRVRPGRGHGGEPVGGTAHLDPLHRASIACRVRGAAPTLRTWPAVPSPNPSRPARSRSGTTRARPRCGPSTTWSPWCSAASRSARRRPAIQYLETSHPPTYYLPRDAFVAGSLREAGGSSFCEWKGEAAYLDVVGGGKTARRAAWHYPSPTPRYASLRGHVALYPGEMDYCLVDGERVEPQPGTFYGGWITSAVVGPFKGGPGSQGW